MPSQDIAAQARAVLSDPRYQRLVPDLPPATGGVPPRPRRRLGDLAPGDDDPPAGSLPRVPRALVILGQSILYLFLASAAVLAGRRWLRRRVAVTLPLWPAAEDGGEPGAPDEGPREDEAAQLAGDGRWAEALHALLLQAIRDLGARSRSPLPRSSTSRELVDLVPLSGRALRAFAAMVRAVEVSFFGGAPVGPEEYAANRERFEALSGEDA